MSQEISNLLEGLDPTVIMRVLPAKITEAEERAASTGLALMALLETPDASEEEVAEVSKVFKIQKGFLASLKAYKSRIDSAIAS